MGKKGGTWASPQARGRVLAGNEVHVLVCGSSIVLFSCFLVLALENIAEHS
jgi:hypothetical protein